MLSKSRLGAVYPSELIFEKFGHLKDGFQSCLAHPQEYVNQQSMKNKIRSMIFTCYAQKSGNMNSWHLGDFILQIFMPP